MNRKITSQDIIARKGKGKIIMLTAYDYIFASLLDEEVDIILTGDSVGNVLLGYKDTLSVSMEEMLHHTKACARGVKKSLLVGDMPFGSYQISQEQAVNNALRFVKEANADAVKVEASLDFIGIVKSIVESGIPVMGHIGLLPQQVLNLGGYRVQGKTFESAKKILDTALVLEKIGCFCIVMECVPSALAGLITEKLTIPTIGIGSGPLCDGQVLVTHDLLGLTLRENMPKFVRQYRNWKEDFINVVKEFKEDVIKGEFPRQKESFSIDEEIIKDLEREPY